MTRTRSSDSIFATESNSSSLVVSNSTTSPCSTTSIHYPTTLVSTTARNTTTSLDATFSTSVLSTPSYGIGTGSVIGGGNGVNYTGPGMPVPTYVGSNSVTGMITKNGLCMVIFNGVISLIVGGEMF